MLERNDFDFYRKLEQTQSAIIEGIKDRAKRHGHDFMIQGPLGMVYYAFTDKEKAYSPAELSDVDTAKALKFRGLLEGLGVLTAGGFRMVISPVMTERDINDALDRFDAAFAKLN